MLVATATLKSGMRFAGGLDDCWSVMGEGGALKVVMGPKEIDLDPLLASPRRDDFILGIS